MILDLSVWQVAAVGGCCVVAAFTQSVSSFGFGIVTVALLPLVGVGIQDTVVLAGTLVIPNIVVVLWRMRRHLSLRRVGWLLLGVPLGLPVGLYLLAWGPEWVLRLLLGATLVFMAVEPFLRKPSEPSPAHRGWAFAAGVCSGALGGALSTGGPPVVIYFYRRHWTKELTKASIILTFAGTVSARAVAYVPAGLFTSGRLVAIAALAPAVVVGSLLGERLFGSLGQTAFRRIVGCVLAICGVYQLVAAARLLLETAV